MAGMEGRVISLESGDDVSPGEEGEILLKGPNVMVAQPDDLSDIDIWISMSIIIFRYPNAREI